MFIFCEHLLSSLFGCLFSLLKKLSQKNSIIYRPLGSATPFNRLMVASTEQDWTLSAVSSVYYAKLVLWCLGASSVWIKYSSGDRTAPCGNPTSSSLRKIKSASYSDLASPPRGWSRAGILVGQFYKSIRLARSDRRLWIHPGRGKLWFGFCRALWLRTLQLLVPFVPRSAQV